jgi:FMN-dependent NADH-azoreductase
MAHTSKIFDTSTVQGIRAAERFKARLNNTHDSVNVYAIGLYRVQIVGLQHTVTTDAQEAAKWNAAGAQRTAEDIAASRKKAAEMLAHANRNHGQAPQFETTNQMTEKR